LVLLVAVVAFYPEVGRPGWISPGGDMTNLMLPARAWATQWLSRGVVPLWNPQTFGGVPFHGGMQAAVFYPPNLMLGGLLSPLTTINVLRLLHIYLFGALTWLFLRFERHHVRAAALLGAVAVSGSALMAAHTDHVNQLAAIAWLPAVVACQWRFWRTGSGRALLLLPPVLAIQILAGHPQAVFYTLLLSAAIAVAWLVRRGVRHRTGRLAVLGVAFSGGLLLASIQWVPTVETARFSRRSIDDLAYPLWGSMQPHHLLATIEPRAFGDPLSGYSDGFGAEASAFVGRTTLLLALLAFGVGIARKQAYAIFWTLVVGAAFVLALGAYGPFHGEGCPSPVYLAYLQLFPPAQHFRVPPRVLLLATWGLAILGAEGLNGLCWWRSGGTDRPKAVGWQSVVAWSVVVVLAVELWWFQRREFHTRPVRHYPAAAVLEGQPAEVLAPLLEATPPGSPLPAFRVFRLMPHDPDYLMDPRPAAVRNRVLRQQPNIGMLLGVAEVEGYEEGLLPPVRYYDFLDFFNRNLRNPDPDAVLLALMNVRYLYADYNLPVESATWEPRGAVDEPMTGRRYRLYENPLWLPRVVWADWLPAEIELDALRGMLSRTGRASGRGDSKRVYGKALLSPAPRSRLVENKRLATLAIRSIEPNRIELENPTKRGGVLLMAHNAYPGWVVQAGGERILCRPATDFSAKAEVPVGHDRLRIVYQPFSFRIAAYLSGVALAVWIAMGVAAIGRSSAKRA
jgi:hypothetical protein